MVTNKSSIRTAGAAIALSGALLAVGTPMVAHGTSATQPMTLTFSVPIHDVHAHSTNVGPKKASPGDGFQESFRPAHPGTLRRQDAIAIGTFGRAMFLGTITLRDGELVYGGSTDNQDDTAYAILGGTGSYASASGTVRLHPTSRTRVEVTVSVTA